MTDLKNIKIKPWWVEMPTNPTRRQQIAEAAAIVGAALALTGVIFWVVL